MAAGRPRRNQGGDVRARDTAAAKRNALRGILALEERRGFDNSAVAGGLDLFIEGSRDELPWLASLFPSGVRRYSDLSINQRRAWTAAVGRRVSRMDAPVRPGTTRRQRAGTASRKAAPPKPRVTLDTPLAALRIVSAPNSEKFQRLDVNSLRDLLYLFPNRHVDYSKVTPIAGLSLDDETTVIGRVTRSEKLRIGPPPGAARIVINDSTGLLTATWFRQSYLADSIRPGARLALSGKVGEFRGRARMENPEYELITGKVDELVHAGNLLPVYPSTDGLYQRTIRSAVKRALRDGLPLLTDHVPQAILRRRRMQGLAASVRGMHFPATPEEYESSRTRLAFDELFMSQLALIRRKVAWAARGNGVQVEGGQAVAQRFVHGLEFSLTCDQKEAIATILEDMAKPAPMGRMLQGEVGSGKTVVALSALLAAAAREHSGAFLAPTEVLAEQHFLSACRQLDATPVDELPEFVAKADVGGSTVTLALLTGSLRRSAKSLVQEMVSEGAVDILIGTHALFQDAVEIRRLALVVVDEQHRFGVEQRSALAERKPRPHLLVMSATPIPRSLNLVVYGDLDSSTLREMPRGRKPISTRWARSFEDRRNAHALARREAVAGRQAFVVCPLIEESDQVRARAATVEYERLRGGVFDGLTVGLLHGRMALAEKQAAMDSFRSGETQVLVSTPVIEVGVDVPNATVMLIESADRFGMAQLHQFRGRVGRGPGSSHCILLADDPSEDAQKRLSAVESISDGFELAEVDLRMRGPGEYLGVRQSGRPPLRIATLEDRELLDHARKEANAILSADPRLSSPAHAGLLRQVRQTTGKPAGIS